MTHHLTAQRALAPVCALALALSLSACSSQPSKEATPSSPPSPSASVNTFAEGIPNPDLPQYPDAMKNYDENGAVAAAEYYLRLSLYGVATNNWDDYNALCQPTCGFCNSYRDTNHKGWENVSSSNMSEMEVLDAYAWQLDDNPDQWRVDILVKRYPSTFTDKENQIHHDEGETAPLAFLLDASNGWHIVELEAVELEQYEEWYGKIE